MASTGSHANSSAHDISRVSSPDFLTISRGGATSPSPSLSSIGRVRSPTPSKRDRIRSKHPAPVHVSKLESVIGNKKKSEKHSSKDKGREENEEVHTTDIGISAEEVYDEYLPTFIAKVRRVLIRSLRFESEWLAWHQPLVRTPFLDRYFVYTSLFGTHSFFLVFVPAAFWFGNPTFSRGLVNTLAFGVYLSSAIKDLFCVPRPFSPPVTRLTVGTTHLEYGFPSTHSTNSVGTALYIYLWIQSLREADPQSIAQSCWWDIALGFYAFSVVYGRIYAGMHSVMDCMAGSALGIGITLAQWYGFDILEKFLAIQGWTVPATIISGGLLLVSFHPEPLDDCPCFEDAIAFIASVMGVSLGRWASLRYEILNNKNDVNPFVSMGKQALDDDKDVQSWQQVILSIGTGFVALALGVMIIFAVRVVVKTLCKLALPSIFRFVDSSFGLVLPRRHYAPSSEYTEVPMTNIIRSPSFIDLPSTLTPTATGGPLNLGSPNHQVSSTTTGIHSRLDNTSTELSHRGHLGSGSISRDSSFGGNLDLSRSHSPSFSDDSTHFPPHPTSSLSVPFTHPIGQGGPELPGDKVANVIAAELSEDERKRQDLLQDGIVTHYDIDVLTKVLVYTNIGFWASAMIPTFLLWLQLI
ncbi:unnamed protein product [Sympodiomycopsis kandeliae]